MTRVVARYRTPKATAKAASRDSRAGRPYCQHQYRLDWVLCTLNIDVDGCCLTPPGCRLDRIPHYDPRWPLPPAQPSKHITRASAVQVKTKTSACLLIRLPTPTVTKFTVTIYSGRASRNKCLNLLHFHQIFY